MTNFDKIKSMSIDDLVEWLDKHGMFDGAPWNIWWDKKYCSNCKSVEIKHIDAKEKLDLDPFYDEVFECAFCELQDENGVKHCRFFPDMNDVPDNKEVIKMWLKDEVKD